MLIYVAIVIALGWAFMRLPAGFLPVDDQGFITADVQTPPEASFNRTLDAVQRVEEFLAQRKGVDNVTFLTGFSFLGQGQNTAQAFVTLKDWSERGAQRFGRGHRGRHQQEPGDQRRDAKISALQPPPIDNLGNSSGFSFRLQDRAQKGYAELMAREGPASHRCEKESRSCRTSMSRGWRRRRRSSSSSTARRPPRSA